MLSYGIKLYVTDPKYQNRKGLNFYKECTSENREFAKELAEKFLLETINDKNNKLSDFDRSNLRYQIVGWINKPIKYDDLRYHPQYFGVYGG